MLQSTRTLLSRVYILVHCVCMSIQQIHPKTGLRSLPVKLHAYMAGNLVLEYIF